MRDYPRIMDFHVHSTFSDGFHSLSDVATAAIQNQVQELCFTDHYSEFKPSLDFSTLGDYIEGITEVKKRYSSQVQIHHGIEIDMTSNLSLSKLLDHSWDLILFEYVFTTNAWENNFTFVCQLKKEYPNLRVGLAHPNLTRLRSERLVSVLEAIQSLQIVVEANANYRNYLNPWFANLDDGFSFSIGSDSHDSSRVGKVLDVLEFFRQSNISDKCIIQL